jgi:hypothetical protein
MHNISTLYAPGSYGNYISWAVYSYSNLRETSDIVKPFSYGGGAHLFRKSDGKNIILPTHEIDLTVDKIIYIAPKNYIEYFNNQITKQNNDNWQQMMDMTFANFNKVIFENWQEQNPEIWQIRELWSFFLQPMFDQTASQFLEYENILTNSNKDVVYIGTDDILDDITGSLEKIFLKFGLVQTVDTNTINTIHSEYMKLQIHSHKLEYMKLLISNCLNGIDTSIQNLTMFDEAYIQHLLRVAGWELMCYGMNKVPTSTSELYTKLIQASN